MDTKTINYPLELNRREKRLSFFRENLLKATSRREPLPESVREEISSHLDKYSLLLSKIYRSATSETQNTSAAAPTDTGSEQAWNTLMEVERKLNNCFSDARLLNAKEQHI